MTRALTEADLRVERDRLLEGGRTPEEVEYMQALAAGVVWVVQMHRAFEGEELLAVYATRERAEAGLRRHHESYSYPEQEFAPYPGKGGVALILPSGSGDLWLQRWEFSPSEKPAGAATPRLPGEPICMCTPTFPRDCPPEGIHTWNCPVGRRQNVSYGTPPAQPPDHGPNSSTSATPKG